MSPPASWYRDRAKVEGLGVKLLLAYTRLEKPPSVEAEVEAYQVFSATRLVFESNSLEGAGTATVGETKKLLREGFPTIPNQFRAFRAGPHLNDGMLDIADAELQRVWALYESLDVEPLPNEPLVKFGDRTKSIWDVYRHYHAYLLALGDVADFKRKLTRYFWLQALRESEYLRDQNQEFWQAEGGERAAKLARRPNLLTQRRLRRLQSSLSARQVPADAGVRAGEYRIDHRGVGTSTVFTAPENIPGAMRAFVKQANKLFYTGATPFDVAARVSHRFVKIHPFPDFNGRMSRLLVAVVLHAAGVPFSVSLRSDKKSRHRYKQALVRADRGNYKAYRALIATSVVDGFLELDENLKTAALPGFAPPVIGAVI